MNRFSLRALPILGLGLLVAFPTATLATEISTLAAPRAWVEPGDANTENTADALVRVDWQAIDGEGINYKIYRCEPANPSSCPTMIHDHTTGAPLTFQDDVVIGSAWNYKVQAYTGASESPTAVTPLATTPAHRAETLTTVVDDDAMNADFLTTGGVSSTGTWTAQSVSTEGNQDGFSFAVGGDLYVASGAFSGQMFNWQTSANLSGTHDVSISYFCDPTRGTAMYDVYDGATKLNASPIPVDQSLKSSDGTPCSAVTADPANQASWKPLGQFTFGGLSPAKVQLVTATGNDIVADAAGFKKVADVSSSSSSSLSSGSSTSSSEGSSSSASSSSSSFSSSSSTSSSEGGSSSNSASSGSSESGSSSSNSSFSSEGSSSSSASSDQRTWIEQHYGEHIIFDTTPKGGHQDTAGGNGAYRGSRLNEVLAYLNRILGDGTTPLPAFGGEPTALKKLLCPIQLMAAIETFPMITPKLSVATGVSEADLMAHLMDASYCSDFMAERHPVQKVAIVVPDRPVALAADGYPISSNPIWNLCVRGVALNRQQIEQNPDSYTTRSGVTIHRSCDWYRFTSTNEWNYPDDAFLTLTIVPNAGGMPVVTAPKGYVVVGNGMDHAAAVTPEQTEQQLQGQASSQASSL